MLVLHTKCKKEKNSFLFNSMGGGGQLGPRGPIVEHFLHNSKPLIEVYMVSKHVNGVRCHVVPTLFSRNCTIYYVFVYIFANNLTNHTLSEMILLRGELWNF